MTPAERLHQLRNGLPERVRLVAVSKGRSLEEIRALVAAGQRDFGENRVAELEEKSASLQGVTWHFIGNLQSNKARRVAELSDYVHSVAQEKVARKLDEGARAVEKKLKVFVEVNVSGEESKEGCAPAELNTLVAAVRGLENLELMGLMTMAPFGEAEAARPFFRELAGLAQAHALTELSMGMSNDYRVAVEEGATWVRVGSALFGENDTLK